MKKIGLIVAHDAKRQGAVNYLGKSEYEWSKGVLRELARNHWNKDCIILVGERHGYDYSEINEMYRQNGGVDLSLELHFNSYTKVARGQEMLIKENDDPKTKEIALGITEYVFNKLGIGRRRDNGIYELPPLARGRVCLDSIKHAKHVMLYEPCFGNTENADAHSVFEGGWKFSDVLYEAIEYGLGNVGEEEPPKPQDIIEDLVEQVEHEKEMRRIAEAALIFKDKKIEHAMAMLEEAMGK